MSVKEEEWSLILPCVLRLTTRPNRSGFRNYLSKYHSASTRKRKKLCSDASQREEKFQPFLTGRLRLLATLESNNQNFRSTYTIQYYRDSVSALLACTTVCTRRVQGHWRVGWITTTIARLPNRPTWGLGQTTLFVRLCFRVIMSRLGAFREQLLVILNLKCATKSIWIILTMTNYACSSSS